MVPVWMTFSDLFKVTIIQRQITWKWYNIQLYLQWLTNRKSYMIYRMTPFAMTLNDPSPSFKVTPFFDVEYLINGTTYIQWNTNRDLHTPYSTVSFGITLSDNIKWLSKIFNDTEHRAVSLQQLSFLYRRFWAVLSSFLHWVLTEETREV